MCLLNLGVLHERNGVQQESTRQAGGAGGRKGRAMLLSARGPAWADSPAWAVLGAAHTLVGCGVPRWDLAMIPAMLPFLAASWHVMQWQYIGKDFSTSCAHLGDSWWHLRGLGRLKCTFLWKCPLSQLIYIPVNIPLSQNIFVRNWCVFFFLGVVWRENNYGDE